MTTPVSTAPNQLAALKKLFLTPLRAKALKSAFAKEGDIALTRLAGSSAPLLMASAPLPAKKGVPVVVIGDSLDDAGYLYHDLVRLTSDDSVVILPSGYKRDIKYGRVDPPNQILRTEALARISAGDPTLQFVVTYPESLAEKVASRHKVDTNILTFRKSEEMDMTEAVKWLRGHDFKEVSYVYEPGHFAVRGSILDIFGYSNELPVRIDFFGDEIDSIRSFDIETQLSQQKLDTFTVSANMANSDDGNSLLDFIDPSTLIFVRDAVHTLSRVKEVTGESFSESAMLADEGDPEVMKNVIDPDQFEKSWQSFRHIYFTGGEQVAQPVKSTIRFDCVPQALYHKNFDLIAGSFTKMEEEGYTIYLLSDSPKQAERLRQIFADRGDNITFRPVDGTLHEGFSDGDTKICIFTDHQIFDRFHKYNLRSERARSGKLAMSLKELQAIEPGDYIVHIDHGVGKFEGLTRTNVNGHMQEMIKLVYANDDTLYVSIHSLHKLAKYRGKDSATPPKINRIGSGTWARLKERTKSKLKDIARDLIKLYAARAQQKGHSFAPDSYLQHELEASFIYEDTPDQLSATKAVKADMESDRPMDRLICGDVGFGKTEVAIRAAFKAAADNKQTAVLVPTTVLAYQHYDTFSKRLKDFPVRVDYLSRARTAKETSAILKDLSEGKIDILIGTHKLIGKKVKFKDLGLLVVDEEQKFGVAVKEKLKELRTNVDTLTMSATPIPRTLQFSIMGARDLSTINTPPPNRHPILTTVGTLTDELLLEAINFELSRNGQVFIINPRIEGLIELENRINRLIPDARTVVGHGQLNPDVLEKTIIDFANHDYDILLATTIVESGIDMPNVNTIIVNNAQNFGLSELHQLRGRVGRSARKAFCYLMIPPGVPLSPTAHRRLQAIESFSDLGSGINIAMQDLDIRGAGNLLGAEQSGFISDLGYETYQKILREAMTELRSEMPEAETDSAAAPAKPLGEEEEFVADTLIESDLELLLPPDYVPETSERIALYRHIDSLDSEAEVAEFSKNLVDRFGKIPEVTEELLRIPLLRRLARKLGVEKVMLKQDKMFIHFVDKSNRAYYNSHAFGKILNYVASAGARCTFRERDEKCSIVVSNVKSVKEALDIFTRMSGLSPL